MDGKPFEMMLRPLYTVTGVSKNNNFDDEDQASH